MQHSIAEELAAVQATVELMIAEIKNKPAIHMWPEQAASTWSDRILEQVRHDLHAFERYCPDDLLRQLRVLLKDGECHKLFQDDAGKFLDIIRRPPVNVASSSPHELIRSYFSKLQYPAIKEINARLIDEHGDVYVVSFENKVVETGRYQAVPPPGCQYPLIEGPAPDDWKREPIVNEVSIPNCYAIVKDGIVAGYSEDFWTDADKYRLVLKQHLGLLAMEAKPEFSDDAMAMLKIVFGTTTTRQEKEMALSTLCELLVPGYAPKAVQEPREGYSKNATVDAIVERYEEMLVKAETETSDAMQQAMTREAELAKQLTDAQAELIAARTKLEVIKQVLDGKPGSAENQVSPEACAIGSVINQDAAGPYDEDNGATLVSASEYQGLGQVPGDLSPVDNVPGIPYKNHNASWPFGTPRPMGFAMERNGNIRRVQMQPVSPIAINS